MTNAHLNISPGTVPTRELIRQVQAEYAEMPGLSVTLAQAQRLWAVDRQTCEVVFRELLERRFPKLTTKGRFVRA